MRATVASSLILLLCAGLSAQTVTSPEAAATGDGSSSSRYPFSAKSNRFQQTMVGLKGAPKTFKSLAFRADQVYSGISTARTIEVQITMAHTDVTKLGKTFANNYVGAPIVVFTRKKVSLPQRKGPYASLPALDYVFQFDKQFKYDGKQDFLIDVQTWNNSATTNYYSDYAGFRVYAERKVLGTGCTATGQTSAMSLTSLVASQLDGAGKSAFRLYWYNRNGVKSAPSMIMVGLRDLNANVSGLCTTIHTDIVLTWPSVSSTTGYFNTKINNAYVYAPFNPAWVGATLYAQALSFDASRASGIKLALSNGVSSKLHGRFTSGKRVQHFSDGSATVGAGPYSNQLVVVFGL